MRGLEDKAVMMLDKTLNPEALEEAFGAYNDAARRKLDTENKCEIHKAGLYAAITAYLAALPRTDQ